MEESQTLTKKEAVELAIYGLDMQSESEAIEIAIQEQVLNKEDKGE